MKHGNPIENNGWFFFTQENLLLITPSNFQKKCTEVYRKEIWNLTPPPPPPFLSNKRKPIQNMPKNSKIKWTYISLNIKKSFPLEIFPPDKIKWKYSTGLSIMKPPHAAELQKQLTRFPTLDIEWYQVTVIIVNCETITACIMVRFGQANFTILFKTSLYFI